MINGNKILYVDDEKINTQVFKIAFSEIYQILIACNGMDGLHLIRSYPDIKLVISDMKMPGMDGLEFIRKIKKIRDLPCALLSGYQETPEIIKALEEGLIVAYLAKPFEKSKIQELIEKYG